MGYQDSRVPVQPAPRISLRLSTTRKQGGRGTDQLRKLPTSPLIFTSEPPFYPLLVPFCRVCALLLAEHDFNPCDLSLRGKGITRRGVGEGSLDYRGGKGYILWCKSAGCMLLGAGRGGLGLLQSRQRGEAVRQLQGGKRAAHLSRHGSERTGGLSVAF